MRFYCIIMKGKKKNNFWFCLCHWSKLIGYSNEHLEKHVALLHTVGCFGGEYLSPQVWTWYAMPPEKLFLFTTTDRRKLAYRKNKLLVLFCTTTATAMFTIHQIKNSSLVYVKHVLLDISIKGQLESKKCLLFIKSKTPPFI